MSKVLCEREDLVAIADAIRGKTGETAEMSIGEMSGKINDIESGSGNDAPTGYCPSLTINGNSDVQIINAIYTNNNRKQSLATDVKAPYTINMNNIMQVGGILYINAHSSRGWSLVIDDYNNLELILDQADDNIFLFKVTSVSPATITFSIDD